MCLWHKLRTTLRWPTTRVSSFFSYTLSTHQARSFASLHAAHAAHSASHHHASNGGNRDCAPDTSPDARPPPKGLVHVPFPEQRVHRVTFACNRVAMAAWRLHLAEPHVDFAAEVDAHGDVGDWDGTTKSSLQLHSEVGLWKNLKDPSCPHTPCTHASTPKPTG